MHTQHATGEATTKGGETSHEGRAASSHDHLSQINTTLSEQPGTAADDAVAVFTDSAVAACVQDFEDAWLKAFENTLPATPPRLDDHFQQLLAEAALDSAPQIQSLLQDLVVVDLEYRWKRQVSTVRELATLTDGNPEASAPRVEDYRELLTAHFGPLATWPVKLIANEYRIRRRCGLCPAFEEYQQRFPEAVGLVDALRAVDSELSRVLSTASPAPQKVLQGDYELLREIARGGMGVVYEAWQRSLKRIVAVKMILAGQLASPEAVRRFYVEAQAAARLSHPHIVAVYEVGQDAGHHFFSMAYVEGENLFARVAREGPSLPAEAARLLHDVAEAVDYAHGQGVVHRDLKPQNVLLTKDQRPMITDFGLAKHVDDVGMTVSGQLVGTPSFMSPEQAQGRLDEVGRRSDVYSLGALLYYLLTGRPPFHTASMAETLRQVIEAEPVSPRSLNPEVNRDLETICLKCLEKDPAKRYATAGQLADDLQRFLAGDAIAARPVSYLERAWRWCRRRPSTAALAATIALVLLVGVPLFAWLWGQSEASQARAKAAQQMAAIDGYHAAVNQARDDIRRARPGWTHQALDKLAYAASLDTPVNNPPELRTEAASCLLGVDVQPPLEIAKGMQSAPLAFSHDGSLLGIGEAKTAWLNFSPTPWQRVAHVAAWTLRLPWISVRLQPPPCHVQVFDLATNRGAYTLTFNAWPLIERSTVVQDGCQQLAFSPDRRWLLAGTRSGYVHAWDLRESPPQHVAWRAHDTSIRSLVFSPDSQRVFTAAKKDKTVKAWEPAAGGWRKAAQYAAKDTINNLSVQNRAAQLVIDTHSAIEKATLDKLSVSRFSVPTPSSAISTPWDDALLVGGHRGLELFAIDRAEVVRIYDDPDSFGRDLAGFHHAQFSADGRLFLALTSSDRKLTLWDVASSNVVFNKVLEADVPTEAALSPDGQRLAVIAARRVLLYRIEANLHQPIMLDKPAAPGAVAWMSASSESALSPDSQPRPPLSFLQPSAGILAISYDHHQLLAPHPTTHKIALSGIRDATQFWDLSDPLVARRISYAFPRNSTLCFSPDGKGVWGISGGLNVWHWPLGAESHAILFQNNVADLFSGRSTLLALAAGHDFVLIGGRQGELIYLANPGGPPQRWRYDIGPVACLAVAPRQDLAACGTEDGRVVLVSLPGGDVLSDLARHDDAVGSIEFSADGQFLVSASLDRSVRLWRHSADRWEELLTLRFPAPVLEARFHPQRAVLAIRVQGEPAIRLLSLNDLQSHLVGLHLGW